MKKILFLIILFSFCGFKQEKYKIIEKNINKRNFRLSIPKSFCEIKNKNSNIFEFVKCYEINLIKQGEINFFSEKILMEFNKNDDLFQILTDKIFAKFQEKNFNKLSKKEKNNYIFDKRYPIKNKIKSKIYKNNYLFEREGLNEEKNKFKIYQTYVFLNKKPFKINWVQFFYKQEKFLKEKDFVDFVEKNKKSNEFNNILYENKNEIIIIPKPNFDNFINCTDLNNVNIKNYSGYFMTLIQGKNFIKKFKVIITKRDLSTEDLFSIYKKKQETSNKKIVKDVKLIDYKNINFIKITREDYLSYICYLPLNTNYSLLIGLEFNKNDNQEKNLEYIYRYRKQIIKTNK